MKKKVLIVTESISYGGLNLVSVNFQQYLDKDKFECVFCVRRDEIGKLEPEITKQGIRVIHVPDSELNYFKSFNFYKKIMSKEKFDIVHCHLPFFSGIVLFAARQCGVKKRIAHAHFSQPYTDTAIYSKKKQAVAVVYRQIMRLFLKCFCNCKLACSKAAGEFLFGKKEFNKNGIILNNGINTDDFIFDIDVRNDIRNELGILKNEIVLAHIGQLYSVKNQSFVISVFYEFNKKNPNSKLLFIGDGDDREMLENKVKSLNLQNNVTFLGLRNDANRLYQAMDCFVFPSIHEGFPLTLVEAQAAKLPCLVSDSITRKVKYNDNFEFLSINQSTKLWCNKIDELLKYDRSSVDNSLIIEQFDIKNIAKKLEQIYSS